ncbi:MAG: hypothetical protein ACJ735_01370 [Actinomycetes bacterium]
MKRFVAAGGLLAVFALSACGGSGPTAAEPPPLSSLLATIKTPPPQGPSSAVVQATVRTYLNGVNAALRTGKTTAAVKASTSTCNCRAELKQIAAVYAKHAHFVGTQVVIVRIASGTATPTSAQAKVTYRIPASAVVTANGKRGSVKAVPTRTVTATVVKQGNRWLVSSLSGLFGSAPHAKTTAHPGATPSGTPKP